MGIFNISAGHNPAGKVGCGAVGLIKESTEARKVKDEVVRLLKQEGNIVYDCTCENGTSQGDVLKKIVDKCNAHKVDLDVSIHFNSGAGDLKGDRKTTGVEVLIYSLTNKSKAAAEKICSKISGLGYKNRGVKARSDLYVLKHTKNPALLVECCFIDDRDDVKLYNAKSMAKAIAEGIMGKSIKDTVKGDNSVVYRIQVGTFSEKKNATELVEKLKKDGYQAIVVTS